jgi:ketosteroid isomerase-like protein
MSKDATRELLDRQAIADLIHDYCRHVDENRADRLASLFFEDCVADYGPALGGPVTGAARLIEGLSAGLDRFEATHHQVSNIQLDFESPDRARGVTYVTAWHRMPGDTPDATVYGQYHDVFERRDGRWGIAERRILVSGETGFPIEWNRTPRKGRP